MVSNPCKNCRYYNSNSMIFVNDGKAFCDNWHCVISHAIERRVENIYQYNEDCFLLEKCINRIKDDNILTTEINNI